MATFTSTTANNIYTGTTTADSVFGGARSALMSNAGGFGTKPINGSQDPSIGNVDILDASAITEGVFVVYGANLENGTLTGLTSGNQITFSNIENVIFNDISSLIDASAATEPIPQITCGGDATVICGSGNDFNLVAAVTICSMAAKEMTK